MTALETLGGIYTWGNAINDAGHVVGDGWTQTGVDHLCMWADGSIQDLGKLAYYNCTGNGINNNDQIVGQKDTQHPGTRIGPGRVGHVCSPQEETGLVLGIII